jgi:GDPmannose 4,6-dehydratase
MKRALITGVTGQDGSRLAEFLPSKRYGVHGVKRRSSSYNFSRIDHVSKDPHQTDTRFRMHYGDMTDISNLLATMAQVGSDEGYNLAAQTVHVGSAPAVLWRIVT